MSKNFHVQGPSISQFNNIAPQKIPRSLFKRDFTYRTTFDADYLIPVFIDEVLPGDDININLNAFTRMATPVKPLMDNLYQDTMWFFIPNRLLWDNWEKFQGQQTNPGDSVSYQIPILDKTKTPMNTTGFTVGSIYDYFGLPTQVTGLNNISALFNRAYDLVFTEWIRDENLQNSITVEKGDGPDNPALYSLHKRGKRKDYFTSALPWPQKGDAITIPLAGGLLPVIPEGHLQDPFAFTPLLVQQTTNTPGAGPYLSSGLKYAVDPGNPTAGHYNLAVSGLSTANNESGDLNWGIKNAEGHTGLVVNTDQISAITINALRQAALYQQVLELDARGGTRYVESIYTRFGVVSPDFRLQRPELIGQGSTRINIYAVPQTAPTADGTTPQGNLAAFGTNAISGGHGCKYSATEHGIILGLMNVRADLTYQQGVPRMFLRRHRLDFYEPLLNGLGEQNIYNCEIFATGDEEEDFSVFGYQERFSDYRFRPSMITGQFRSTYAQTLDVWHLSEEFEDTPLLNSDFIRSNTPMGRVLAVPSEPQFLTDIHFSYNHVRPMPIRSNPGIDRL